MAMKWGRRKHRASQATQQHGWWEGGGTYVLEVLEDAADDGAASLAEVLGADTAVLGLAVDAAEGAHAHTVAHVHLAGDRRCSMAHTPDTRR